MRALRLDAYRLVTTLALACAGALAAVPKAHAADVDELQAALPRAAVLSGVRTAYSDGDRIGSVNDGADCSASTERAWTPLVRHRIETEVAQVFREELAKVSFSRAVGASGSAPLKVHAFINELNVAVCQAGAGAWQGGFRVQVGWQIVAPETGKVLYQASTDGAFTLASPQRVTSAAALREAFGVAVRGLLQDRRFTAMLQQNESRQLAMVAPVL